MIFQPFPHISKETASSKESPFSDCPTLKPANAEDAEEIDEPPPLLDRGILFLIDFIIAVE